MTTGRTYQESVKEQFESAARFYGDLYHDDSPKAHLFTTRVRRVYELLEGIEATSILDVGCGPGIVAGRLLAKYDNYFGVDIAKEMLRDCRRRYGDNEHVLLVQASMEMLPFPDSSFNVVLCLGALEYTVDISAALGELSRVVRRNGSIVISMQNIVSPYRFWECHVYRGHTVNNIKRLLGREPLPELPEKPIRVQALRRVLILNDFRISDIIHYDFNLWLTPLDRRFPGLAVSTSRRLEFLGRGPLGFLGTGYIVRAEKAA
jgi:ubiquinone/menaquinone biosynthesis C-methylase UbiE